MELHEYAIASSKGTSLEKIQTLETMIEYYYNMKDYYYSRGECYIKYFSDMWEHCHNSRNPDFEYIKPYEEQLSKLKASVQ